MNSTTLLILAATAVLLIAYDVYAYWKGTTWSISYNLWALGKRYPIIPFALGILAGHLFWVQCGIC